MRLNALSTLSLLLPLALSNPTLETSHANPLQLRSPINAVPAAPSPTSPYFMLTGFEAFISSPAYPTMHSRAVFTLTLVHPVLAQGWSTLCKITTASDLCDTDDFFSCQPVKGVENVDERLSFRFSTDVGSVEIMRLWTYNEMHLKTMAREDANWDEGVPGGNVTVSEYGKLYQGSTEWAFAWKETVG